MNLRLPLSGRNRRETNVFWDSWPGPNAQRLEGANSLEVEGIQRVPGYPNPLNIEFQRDHRHTQASDTLAAQDSLKEFNLPHESAYATRQSESC